MTPNKIRTEPFDLMQYFYLAAHDPVIRGLIRFSGRLDFDALRQAVDFSVCAVPQFGCCFSRETHTWEDRGLSSGQMVHVEEAKDDGISRAHELLKESLDFLNGPHLKLYVVRGCSSDTLCVIISHLVTDGAGLRQYLYLLAELYSNCVKGTPRRPEPGDRSLRQITKQFNFREKLAILSAPMKFHRQDDSMLLPLEGKAGETFFVTRRIEPERFSKCIAYAKKKGATVNDLLMAAYFRAHHAMTHCTVFEMPCPVDLRKYLPKENRCGVCNLTSSYMCRLSVQDGESFDETLRMVSAQMTAQKNSIACLKGPMALDLLFRGLPYPAVKRLFYKTFSIPRVSYTNLGILSGEGLHFEGVPVADAYLTTAVKHSPYFQVSVSTFAGRCTLTSNMNGPARDCKTVEAFYDRMIGELESLD